ncbi:MAG: MarR family transcriptional regulator [Desulfobacteraceae bacterium]
MNSDSSNPKPHAPTSFPSSPEERRRGAGGYAESILRSLRRIIRAIDQHSRQLSSSHHLTVPQLVCLHQILQSGPITPGNLAKKVFISQATVTGILDRMEARGLIRRSRNSPDRRQVIVSLTDTGQHMARDMPWPLQERFASRLASLPDEGQQAIDRVLRQIVDMMEASEIEAWPIIGSGTWNELAEPKRGSE